jgi:hypothetical protein
MMQSGKIISLNREREQRRRESRRWRDFTHVPEPLDPLSFAVRLHREVVACGGGAYHWVPVDKLVEATGWPLTQVVVAAVYADVMGWVIYAPFGVFALDPRTDPIGSSAQDAAIVDSATAAD